MTRSLADNDRVSPGTTFTTHTQPGLLLCGGTLLVQRQEATEDDVFGDGGRFRALSLDI
jgi:hypothetical protein